MENFQKCPYSGNPKTSALPQASLGALLLTGGTGFFGKSILAAWAAGRIPPPDRLTILSRNPSAFISVNPMFARLPFVDWIQGDVRSFVFPKGHYDAIIHAATSAVTTLSGAEQTSVIVEGTRHVIDCARACGGPTILFTSSGAVYGPQVTMVDELAECRPTTAYGKGKLDAEKMLLDSGLQVKIARCFAFTGRHLNRDIHYAIGNFIRDALAQCPIVIHGDGTPLRSYLHADDLVTWLFAILEKGEVGRPYNVGSDYAVSIRELAETVRHVLDSRSRIVVESTPIAGKVPSVYVPVIARARKELGLSVAIPLESAIRYSI